jgi:hypothetical protein
MGLWDTPVEATLEKLADYLEDALAVVVAPRPWSDQRLPHFLKETYRFGEIELLGRRCLLVLDYGTTEQTPATVRKHIRLLQPRWNDAIIYVRPRVTAYNRKRLVQQKVPFIVPGNQMYLPTVGIDFREHFRRLYEGPENLSPSAQALLIYTLLGEGRNVITPKEAAADLGYSAMTMTRAFNELEATRLAQVSSSGKERHLRLAATLQDTWNRALPLLRSPLKKRVCIRRIEGASGSRAGLTALAEYTMLASPRRPTLALSQQDWSSLRRHHKVAEVPDQDPDALEIEVWSYAPAQFAEGGIVDPLSLYLSLRGSDDERVAASLEELMEKVKW